jgi:hypothetical protein
LAKLRIGYDAASLNRCALSLSCLFLCVFVMLNLRVLLSAAQVRHMSLSELGATDEMLKVSAPLLSALPVTPTVARL